MKTSVVAADAIPPPARRRRTVAAMATVMLVPGTALLSGGSAHAVAVGASGAPVATRTLAAEAGLARSRLATNLAQPHPGQPEAVTHPAADGLGSGQALQARAGPPSASPSSTRARPTGLLGIDVAAYQGNVNWSAVAAKSVQFAYVKATEGTYYIESTYFPEQYNGSYNVGLIRGAYHFGVPNNSTGAAQADYFVASGGGWSADGHTLPGMLDLEVNPYGAVCYGLTTGQMAAWVASFDNEYKLLTGRMPELYTSALWWNTCTGGSAVAARDLLTVANWGSTPFPLPGGWTTYTIWQYTDRGLFGVDGDVFPGSRSILIALAEGHARSPAATPKPG